MATLPEAFDSALRKAIAARAVWLPGKAVQIGDVLVRQNDQFRKVAHISAFSATAQVMPHTDISLDLKTARVKQRLFQANAELPDTAALDLSAEASVKLEFGGKSEFMLKTPTLSGVSIQNMLEIGQRLGPLATWKHEKFFIVEELYSAADWSFLGNTSNSSNFELSGKGAGILSFLTAGISFGLKSSGNVDLKIMGKGGAVAMNLAKVRRDGSLEFPD